MLIEFTIENFLSIKEEYTFSMEATKYKSDHQYNSFEQGSLNLLTSSVIFGPNGSGKSTIVYAMKLIRDIIEKNDGKILRRIIPFQFNVQTKNKPSKLEVKFLYDDVIYRYGFKVQNQVIVEEWLFYKKNKPYAKETPYFTRDKQTFNNHGDFKKEADLIKKSDKTREDKLYLVIVSEFNGEISRKVVEWFNIFNSFSSIYTDLMPFTIEKLRDKNDKKRIIDFLNSADFGIVDLVEKKITLKEIKNADELPEELKKELEEGLHAIDTYHNLYDGSKYVGSESISLASESDGTKKLFDLAGAIIETLDKGEILIMDELDNSFHTKMLEEIIKLFNSKKNTKHAQLIFVCHDTNILTQKIFRRDQIWFTDKNIYGESELYSLIEFGIRKDTQLEKNYLSGKYGSIPVISQLEY